MRASMGTNPTHASHIPTYLQTIIRPTRTYQILSNDIYQSSTFIHESTLLGSPDFYSNWEKPEPIYMYPLVISSGEKGIEQAPVEEFPLDPKTLISCLISTSDQEVSIRAGSPSVGGPWCNPPPTWDSTETLLWRTRSRSAFYYN